MGTIQFEKLVSEERGNSCVFIHRLELAAAAVALYSLDVLRCAVQDASKQAGSQEFPLGSAHYGWQWHTPGGAESVTAVSGQAGKQADKSSFEGKKGKDNSHAHVAPSKWHGNS